MTDWRLPDPYLPPGCPEPDADLHEPDAVSCDCCGEVLQAHRINVWHPCECLRGECERCFPDGDPHATAERLREELRRHGWRQDRRKPERWWRSGDVLRLKLTEGPTFAALTWRVADRRAHAFTPLTYAWLAEDLRRRDSALTMPLD